MTHKRLKKQVSVMAIMHILLQQICKILATKPSLAHAMDLWVTWEAIESEAIR